MVLMQVMWTSVNYHVIRIMEATPAHLTPAEVAQVQSVVAIVATTSACVTGLVLDSVQRKHLTIAVAALLGAASLWAIQYCSSFQEAFIFAVLFGVPSGMLDIVYITVYPHLFGTSHIGHIMGFVGGLGTLAAGS